MASFPQASPSTPCALLYPPPYAPRALPISFVSISPPAQYWVRSTDHSAPRYAAQGWPLPFFITMTPQVFLRFPKRCAGKVSAVIVKVDHCRSLCNIFRYAALSLHRHTHSINCQQLSIRNSRSAHRNRITLRTSRRALVPSFLSTPSTYLTDISRPTSFWM